MAGQRYWMLDALRGIAALTVVLFHLSMLNGYTGSSPNGVIAVDFFFCLSGFVLASAHESQICDGRLTPGRFLQLRLIRVGPMVVCGSLVGLLFAPLSPAWADIPGSQRWITSALSFLVLPNVTRAGEFLWINTVFWSLLAELLVNAFYGIVIGRLDAFGFTLLTLGLAGAFALSAVILKTFDLHMGDWMTLVPTLIRAAASFFVGVGVFRMACRRPPPRFGAAAAVILLILILLPWPIGANHFNLAIVFTIVPLIVYLGASAMGSGPRWAYLLGTASFPLYAVHAPIAIVFALSIRQLATAPWVLANGLFIALALIVAICLARMIDEPLRRSMRARLRRHTAPPVNSLGA